MSDFANDSLKSPQKKIKMDDSKYLPQLLAEKDSLDSSFTHAMNLISAEIDRIQKGETKKDEKETYLDLFVNFVGKILGPGGNTIKRLQEETGAKISVLGKGSMKDKNKEEELRKGGEAKYTHLSMELHVFIEVHAPIPEAYLRMAHAMDEVKKFLTPEPGEEEQYMDPHFLNGSQDGSGRGRGMGRGRGGPPGARGRGMPRGALVVVFGEHLGEPQDEEVPLEAPQRVEVLLEAEEVQLAVQGLQLQELGCFLRQHFHTRHLHRAKQRVMMTILGMVNLMLKHPMKATIIIINKRPQRILNTTTTDMVRPRTLHTSLTLKMTGKAPGPLLGLEAKRRLPDITVFKKSPVIKQMREKLQAIEYRGSGQIQEELMYVLQPEVLVHFC
ncbi:hypothetical protein WMY93_017620 [Mugilogobius chulae]|uniref:K Homology domain-containing protein n=1 Tax=Mugilogobius chulae TaxID=88201 RepID=A0AAW0NRI7_9GOBI